VFDGKSGIFRIVVDLGRDVMPIIDFRS
jgi:hypothetical protein